MTIETNLTNNSTNTEINSLIELNKLTGKDCKCIRFINGNKFYNNGCKIHKNEKK